MNAVLAKLDISKHKSYLLKILLDISKDNILSKNLVFKWWTALLLFYNLDRFSTDLDFDLVWLDLDENEILDRLWKILKKYWELKELIAKRYTIFWLVSYWNIDHNIKIEINKRWLSWKYTPKTLMGIDFLVMNLEDMCANKFLALTKRSKIANRDIYDVHFILEKWFDINRSLIEEKTGADFSKYIQVMIEFLEWLWNKFNILDWLGLVLDEDRKKWIKENLIKETIFLLGSLI